ncbi:ribonucleotide-diphosphate reductase subunit alpha, partial [Niallia circulans]
PTFLNAGRSRRGEMVSCFLLEMDDSLNSIFHNINTAGQLSKIGGGVALNLSKLRARNEQIKGIDNAASGVVPVMKLLEDTFSYANQLGQRKGAGAVYLNVFHWDVSEFLDTKKINADEKSRIQTLSIGLIVEHKLFELARDDKDLYVFAPYSVYKEYGVHMADMRMDDMYEELVANPNVKKRVLMTARELLVKIA